MQLLHETRRLAYAATHAIALGLFGAGVSAQPSHPLDGLSAEELSNAIAILRKDGYLTDDSRFPLIELLEPDKEAVLAWKSGDPVPRQVRVVVKQGSDTHRGLVDLGADTVVQWDAAAGESMIMLEEFLGAMDLALSHPAFAAALGKRKLTAEDVFCLPLTAGNFGVEEEAGRRIMKVPCYVLPSGSNFYARPIEGLFAVVDLNAGEVMEVVDTGVLPLPEQPWGYTEAEIEGRHGALRPETNPARLHQPDGANFKLHGSRIEWDMWRFHYRVDKRPGVVVSLIQAKDRDRWRSVLYQAHLSEVFVPYMDPSEGWYWRTYMDSGEYGFGLFLSPLREGVDCPDYALYLPAVLHQDNGQPLEIPSAICIFERNIGDPAWRHFEIFAQSETEFVPAEGRPWTELVLRSASEVGNYDYLIDYVFQQDGKIRIMVGSTGLDAVKGVASTSMGHPGAAEDTQYGTLIAPHLVAPNHDHFFNFRLDFDIDGTDNSFMRTGLVAAELPDDSLRRSLWTTQTVTPATELDARYRVNPETPAMYHVMNTNQQSGLGHHPGYMVSPLGSVAYSPLDSRNDPPIKRNAYIDFTHWVTPYDPLQRYAGGEYAFQSDGSDTLSEWVKAERPIVNTDIVNWYTMGFHHIPHMEDWPVMSTMWKGVVLAPFNFFDHNPAITSRLPKTE